MLDSRSVPGVHLALDTRHSASPRRLKSPAGVDCDPMRYVPILAVVVTGLALYVSGGVLDQVLMGNSLVRVALLPPWQALGGSIGLAALGLLWLDRRAVPRGTLTAVRSSLGPLVLPALGLAALLLPYLPLIPDRVPALQMLAGPLRGVIWLAILGQLAWVLWQSRLLGRDWVQGWMLKRLAVLIGVVTALGSGTVATRLTGTALFPAGDEPHYLILMQSLWRDGDLKIENNHLRGDYHEYFAPDLAPHYLTRGADDEIYSIHPVGLPVVMAPVYAAGGYRAVVFAMVLIGAAAAGLTWLWVVRSTKAAGAATFAWAVIALTTPFLFNSFAVYPEIAAALAVIVAFTRAVDASARSGLARWLPVGVACAALPWLSTKYAPLSAALVLIALARIVRPTIDKRQPEAPGTQSMHPALGTRHSALGTSDAAVGTGKRTWHLAAPGTMAPVTAVVVPYGLSLGAWFFFFSWTWGSPWPQAPYGGLVQTSPFNLTFGAPGLLFDQEYGVLAYAPVYILAATGLWWMWREGDELRRQAVEISLALAALVGTVGAFRIWWGGTAAPGRPITSGLLLLALPIAMAFRSAPEGSARRAAQHLLLWLSIGVAGILCFAQEGFLISNGRDGTSRLLEYLSPRWPAWTAAPSFTYHEPLTALAHTAVWLGLAVVTAVVLTRIRTARPGVASLAAIGGCSSALLAGALVVPLVPVTPAWPGLDLRARPRAPLLEAFDGVRRPVGIEYTPLRVVAAGTIASQAALEVVPGSRSEPQPIRVLHNGRLSLPAGHYRLEVDWNGTRSGETIGLQIGRTGEPWRTWHVEPRTGERWATEFILPLDAGFVGVRGTPELERVVGHIAMVPLSIVDAARRPKLPAVTGASLARGGSYFYYDDNAFPEAVGFWVRGRRTTRVTIHRERGDGPLKLRINSGLIRNRLHVSTFGWSHTVSLEPKLPDYLEVPAGNRALITLELTADEEFVPREHDPTSQDLRPLGVWVEVTEP